MGPKGLNILAITHEDREQVLKLLAQAPPPGSLEVPIGLGGGGNYPNTAGTVPYCWIVGADGKVVWQGNTGGLPGKLLEAEVAKVKLTPEMKAAKAEKALANAQTLVADKQVVRGLRALEQVSKDFKGTEVAKRADEARAAAEKDASLKSELDAQKSLEKIVGGLEVPKDKLKKKEREGKAAQIEAFLKSTKDAPVAVEMANMWVKVLQEDWTKNAK